ncbi:MULTISPECIES: hypothetical protein [unclassified Ruegeria]|uniref:hypothetical protein n=1 Tax=unclassified Ruegeria TaxID=2625375 RepID=UPI001489E22D|nr:MULTISPECIES: hypothetical protein [unclassified Ruegeria]
MKLFKFGNLPEHARSEPVTAARPGVLMKINLRPSRLLLLQDELLTNSIVVFAITIQCSVSKFCGNLRFPGVHLPKAKEELQSVCIKRSLATLYEKIS